MLSGYRVNEQYHSVHPLVFINGEKLYSYDGVGGNGTVFATTPMYLNMRGMCAKKFGVYFRGIRINQDTIVNCHMVPPYPKHLRSSTMILKTY